MRKGIGMTMDYYAEARAVARRLIDEGRRGEAQELEDAITTGSTGTEILMSLRWHLQQLEGVRGRLSTDTFIRIRSLADAIGSALG